MKEEDEKTLDLRHGAFFPSGERGEGEKKKIGWEDALCGVSAPLQDSAQVSFVLPFCGGIMFFDRAQPAEWRRRGRTKEDVFVPRVHVYVHVTI